LSWDGIWDHVRCLKSEDKELRSQVLFLAFMFFSRSSSATVLALNLILKGQALLQC
jgi:hypothetical protein